MYKKIIVPVDITQIEKGEKILRSAASLLYKGGTIILLNVVEDVPGYLVSDYTTEMMVEARQKADTALIDLRGKLGVEAEIEIRQGSPAREILAAAEQHGADLVIVASHVPDLSNYFIGATADRVVRHAKCSVLIDR
ncbi:universal stress protein [Neorhizobium alkalisoli]|uniref:Nucleotide-binding universal stress UspA family protein n=1 Tax=Neorhizobium alkalisoli TaxID=528178 RepID=A0A561QWN2_9HYPH|nr:universal stress protein [Neorhizobium alkalisoli]TWF54752.1 nucleotide-binding universal stress UspA family protein [Neorhizobium alkalisoli]